MDSWIFLRPCGGQDLVVSVFGLDFGVSSLFAGVVIDSKGAYELGRRARICPLAGNGWQLQVVDGQASK